MGGEKQTGENRAKEEHVLPDTEKNVKAFYEAYSACFQRIRAIENELHTPQQNTEEWFRLLEEKSRLLRNCYIQNAEML